MAAILQMTYSNAFSQRKLLYFSSNFTEICSQGSNYQFTSIGSDDGLVPNRRQGIFWTKGGLIYWCMYVSLSLNELTHWGRMTNICIIDYLRLSSIINTRFAWQQKLPVHQQPWYWLNSLGIFQFQYIGGFMCVFDNKIQSTTYENDNFETFFGWMLQGLYSLRRPHLTGIGIPIINLRRSDDRLRFIMGISILIKRCLLSE